MWGAIHSYTAVEPKDTANDKNYLVIGPWASQLSQSGYEGFFARTAEVEGNTTEQFRRDVLASLLQPSICWMQRAEGGHACRC